MDRFGEAGRASTRHRSLSVLAAAILAIGLAAAPPAAGPALAAGPLRIEADAVYDLDPAAGRVHVEIDFRLTNNKPDSAQFIYFYRDVRFAIQPEARSVRASDRAGALSTTTKGHANFIDATVHLRANLYFHESTSFTIRYDLVGGQPRSSSPTRVGRAYATFGVWAWGDEGLGTVEVDTPQGFGSQIVGDDMAVTSTAGRQTLRAAPADPSRFFAIVTTENPLAYASTRISLAGGVEIVVRSWPEDKAWNRTVSDTLRTGLPDLQQLIGLDWPVDHDLNVRERFTPDLEGYAGIFFNDDQRIDVSEDLDPLVIVHEASHAWFNDGLFSDRWIYEGLADTYAWRVLTAEGQDVDGPQLPDLDDPGAAPLASWAFPKVIRDQETDDRERYGYDTSFWLMDQIVASVGVEAMRGAFANADADVTAYPGAGAPEHVPPRDSWRRFLDLVQPPDQPDDVDITNALVERVAQSNDEDDLLDRDETREAYRQLLLEGDGWLPSWYVREPMGAWRFDLATSRIGEAEAVLDLRDQVADAASAAGLEPDDGLRNAYETGDDGFAVAMALGQRQLDAVAALRNARAAVETPTDVVAGLGLAGQTPQTDLDAARAAFQRGDLDAALAMAAAVSATIAGAAGVGQVRLAVGLAVALGLLLLLVALLRLRRGRRRARLVAAAATAPPEAYATLAADPDPGAVALPAGPSDVQGGPEPGDPSADA